MKHYGAVGRAILPLLFALGLVACGPEPSINEPVAAAGGADVEGEWLATPYTADEIRDTWGRGFTLRLRRREPERESFERWTVLTSDAQGAEIEFQPVAADGAPIGAATSSRSTWTELRDHARFPIASSTRERDRRATSLGELDGWRYVVRDEAAGTVIEFFFADGLAGAPVEMHVRQGDTVVMEVTQLARDG